jgi:hypothetical protein
MKVGSVPKDSPTVLRSLHLFTVAVLPFFQTSLLVSNLSKSSDSFSTQLLIVSLLQFREASLNKDDAELRRVMANYGM